jgi:hypothetical protein
MHGPYNTNKTKNVKDFIQNKIAARTSNDANSVQGQDMSNTLLYFNTGGFERSNTSIQQIASKLNLKVHKGILIIVPSTFVTPVQENQQMLKGVVSFIILIRLPRHVSAANCYLQGVTRSL